MTLIELYLQLTIGTMLRHYTQRHKVAINIKHHTLVPALSQQINARSKPILQRSYTTATLQNNIAFHMSRHCTTLNLTTFDLHSSSLALITETAT